MQASFLITVRIKGPGFRGLFSKGEIRPVAEVHHTWKKGVDGTLAQEARIHFLSTDTTHVVLGEKGAALIRHIERGDLGFDFVAPKSLRARFLIKRGDRHNSSKSDGVPARRAPGAASAYGLTFAA